MKLKLLQVKEPTDARIASPEDVFKEMAEEAKADRECFWVLHLNTWHTIIEKELVAIGTLSQATVHPREVFKKATLNSAASIITVHNHPSGNLTPSTEDKQMWALLKKAGELLLIPVEDNLIISRTGVYSELRDV
ncbi:MAG: JAB domain-containing protein [Chloroflexota bacterium]